MFNVGSRKNPSGIEIISSIPNLWGKYPGYKEVAIV
jgi:hypothetical protein